MAKVAKGRNVGEIYLAEAFLLLLPLIVVPYFLHAFEVPKEELLRLFPVALLLLYLGRMAAGRESRVPVSPPLLPLCLFTLWVLIETLRSPVLSLGLWEAGRWLALLAAFVAASAAAAAKGSRRIVTFACLPALPVALLGLAQFAGFQPFAYIGWRNPVGSTLGNPNFMAHYLSITVPLCWGLARSARGRGEKAFWIPVSSLSLAAIVVSRSRGALIALAAAGGVLLLLSLRKRGALRRLLPPVGLSLLLALGPLAAARTFRKTGRIPGHVPEKVFTRSPYPALTSSWRLSCWLATLPMAGERPLAGWGAGSFRALYMERQGDFFRSGRGDGYAHVAEPSVPWAHNDYLQILAEYGAVGLLLFLAFLLLMARSRSGKGTGGELRPFISAAAAEGLLLAAVTSPVSLPAEGFLLFSLAGLLCGGGGMVRLCPPAGKAGRAAATLLMLFPLLLLCLSGRRLLAEYCGSRGVRAEIRSETADAVRDLGRAVALSPRDGRYRAYLARSLIFQTRYAEALSEMERCIETNNEFATRIEAGRLENALGRPERALPHFLKASSFVPLDPLCRQNLAYTYAFLGRGADAVREYHLAFLLDPSNPEAAAGLAACAEAMGAPERARLWRKESKGVTE